MNKTVKANTVLLMTRILTSVFYISSMRKTSQKFNSDIVIQNIVTFHTHARFRHNAEIEKTFIHKKQVKKVQNCAYITL